MNIMTLLTIVVQFALSIPLFFLINWIGNNTSIRGYISFTLPYTGDTRPGFNFILRVFTPVVYIIIVSAALKEMGLDVLTKNIYLITLYYFIFRWVLICLTKDILPLYNWSLQMFYLVCSLGVSYFIYAKFLRFNISLLPDLKDLTNAVWLSIFAFVYYISNQMKLSYARSIHRREKYFINKYNEFSKKFDKYIPSTFPAELRMLVYSIMIVENYNRPPLVRLLEYIVFFLFRGEKSMGIMQVKSKKFITNQKSIEMACKKIHQDYKNTDESIHQTIYKYNPSEEYVETVYSIFRYLIESNNPSDQTYNPIPY